MSNTSRCLQIIAAIVVASGCRSLPADFDGRPDGARPLALGVAVHDSMKCDEGDCADWYTLELDKKGPITLQLDPDTGGAWNVEVEVILYDDAGTPLARQATEGRPTVTVRSDLAPGKYFIAVGSATGGNVVPYTLAATQDKRPPAGPTALPGKKTPAGGGARVETKRGSVLEVSDEGRSVLLDIGKSQGVRVGLKGRLLRRGAAPAAFEIVEVYPEGSLARLSSGKAEANSTAEIEVPVAPPAR